MRKNDEFTANFVLNSLCRILKNNDDPLLVTDKRKEEAHEGKYDYLECNEGIAYCEIRNHKMQLNRFQCGLAPEKYFNLNSKKRELLFASVCKSLQATISGEIPDAALSTGATAIFTITKRNGDKLQIDLAYLGDSMAFLIVENKREVLQFEQLNPILHRADVLEERKRLESRGHLVRDGRISRQLRCSRILGYDYFNLKKDPSKQIIIHDPTFVTRELMLEKNTCVRLLVCNSGLAECDRNKSESAFIKDLYLVCRKNPLEKLPYEMTKLANKRGVRQNVTCSLIDFSSTKECIYQALFSGSEGVDVAILAKKKLIATLNAKYSELIAQKQDEELTIRIQDEELSLQKEAKQQQKPPALKLEYVFSEDEQDSFPPQQIMSSREVMFAAIANQTNFSPSHSIQPAQEIEDIEPLKRKASGNRFSFHASSQHTPTTASPKQESAKRPNFGKK